MKFILKNLVSCLIAGSIAWVSLALAQDVSGQQDVGAGAVLPVTSPSQDPAPVVQSPAPDSAPAAQISPASEVVPAAPVPDMTPATPVVSTPAAEIPFAVPAARTIEMSRSSKDAVCISCHDENSNKPILEIYQTRHGVKTDPRTPSCQSCHGESEHHLHGVAGQKGRAAPDVLFGSKRGSSGAFTPSEASVQNEVCLSCHRNDVNRSHWEGSTHQSRDVACASCHEIHAAHDKVRNKLTQPEVCFTCHKEQRAQINKPSHHPISEGKMNCSDCHNPHGSVGPKLMKRDSVNETCYTCHMEKRGPFVHEHEPVAEDCTICHNPHGTTAESMLKMRPPFLCNSCHTPHSPIQPLLAGQAPAQGSVGWWNNTTITQGRACLNCHTQVHGSNNPSSANPSPQNLFR